MALYTLIVFVLIRRFNQESQRHIYSLGYSCVVFGWMTIESMAFRGTYMTMLGLFAIPSEFAPFFSLLVTQLIVPNASFIGHLSGILIGYLVSFGAFYWFSDYLFICTLMWTIIFSLKSLKTTTNLPMPCLVIEEEDIEIGNRARIVNGVIEPSSRPSHFDDFYDNPYRPAVRPSSSSSASASSNRPSAPPASPSEDEEVGFAYR
eukprot:TRINITY_DN18049_c0_g1_i2.p1 TRINITY_DN18049_c0_g1~~TRINITY_DN18049_c0_g1_i2.p1  ORF type:complete len:218 (-),score=19.95 TRINITY_DN18049_c0_g1_i2:95-709(-)